MNRFSERLVIYAALIVLCALTAAFVGTAAGVWSFFQVVAVIEFIYWMAKPAGNVAARNG